MGVRALMQKFLLTVALCQAAVIAKFCSFDDVAVQSPQAETQRQEIYLGFLLPVSHYDPATGNTCGIISENNMIHVETFFWAISSYYDRHNNTSPRARIRGVVLDTCDSPDLFTERFEQWNGCQATKEVAKPNMLVYLSYDHGGVLARAAKLLKRTNDSLISASPYNPRLDAEIYPRFYQMTPTVSQQAEAVLSLLKERGWANVNVVYVDDEYGRSALMEFTDRAKENDIYIRLVRHLSPRADDSFIRYALEDIRSSVSPDYITVVIVFAYGTQTVAVQNQLNDRFVVVSSNYFDDVTDGSVEKSGSVKLALRYEPPGDRAYVNLFTTHFQGLTLNRTDVLHPWFETYFKQKLKCGTGSTTNCQPGQKLGNVISPSRRPVAVITRSVDIIIGAFLESYKDGCSDIRCFADIKRDFHAALQNDMKEVGLTLKNWEYGLYSSRIAGEDRNISSVQVGYVRSSDSGPRTSVEGLGDGIIGPPNPDRTSVAWIGGTRFDLGHDWIIAIGVLASLGIILVIVAAILIIVLKRKATVISYALLYGILLFGAFLGYLTLYAFIPIPTLATCTIIRLGIGLSYSVCLSVMVVIALKLLRKLESSFALRIFIYFVLALLIAVEAVIIVIWLILVLPGATHVLGNNGALVRVCNHFTSDVPIWMSFIRTDFENHLLALIYIMVLVVLLLVLGLLVFRKRRVMMDPMFNIEAMVILLAGVGTAVLWLAWALVGGLMKNHAYAQEFGDGALAFGLWLILTLLVVLLLVQLIFYWKSSNGKLRHRKQEMRTMPVMNVLENRHVTDGDVHEQIAFETTKETTTVERPIKIVENERVIPIEVTHVEESRNHTSRTNGKVVTAKQTTSEVHTPPRESQTLPRDHERYAVHISQAKLSGTSDNLKPPQHHHVVRHHSSGHHSAGNTFEHHHNHHTSGHHHAAGRSVNSSFDPYALHLKHPKSEKTFHPNTSTHVTEGGGHVVSGDTSFAHSDLAAHTTFEPHPVYTKSPYGGYVTSPIYYSNRRPDYNNQRVLRISREASGRPPSRHGMSFSEYDRVGQYSRSFRRTKSEEQLGSL